MADVILVKRSEADAGDLSNAIFRTDLEEGEVIQTQGGEMVAYIRAQTEPNGDRFFTVSVPAPISAINDLEAPVLFEGQNLTQSADYAARTATTNFQSTAGDGGIASTSVAPIGAASVTAPLAKDALVGYRVTVTDNEGNVTVFETPLAAVQFKVTTETTGLNELRININEIVPAGESIAISTADEPYPGSYTPTAGDLRGDPFDLSPPRLDFAGLEENLVVGSILTVRLGFWATSESALSLVGVIKRGATTVTTVEEGDE